jgi:hypothetical protein
VDVKEEAMFYLVKRAATGTMTAVGLGLLLSGCSASDLIGPSAQQPQFTFVMGSSCAGRLNSAVNIYVDQTYKGQTTGTLAVNSSAGLHQWEAFTDGRRFHWGPDEDRVPDGGLRMTLDC